MVGSRGSPIIRIGIFEAAKGATKVRFALTQPDGRIKPQAVYGPRPRFNKGGSVDHCYADIAESSWCEGVVIAYGEGG